MKSTIMLDVVSLVLAVTFLGINVSGLIGVSTFWLVFWGFLTGWWVRSVIWDYIDWSAKRDLARKMAEKASKPN